MKKKLAVIGAGPKGIAIATKAHILEKLNKLDVEVTVYDEHGIAANWDGSSGYTDGDQKLGTPPEKDIGFPYNSAFGNDVDQELYRYSWSSYLVNSRDFGRYVDRGKPHPSHNEWATYLQWVAKKFELNLREERVVEVGPAKNESFYVQSINGTKKDKDYYHGVVLTGPGKPLKIWGSEHEWNESIIDGRVVWQRLAIFSELSDGRIALIGAGETAASIAVTLVQRLPYAHIDIINRHGTLYTRGESFHENELYTDSTRWLELDETDREDFLRRTDRGVFSVEAKKTIDHAKNIKIITGNVLNIIKKGRVVDLELERGGKKKKYSYDKVIVAIGFDPLGSLELLTYNLSTHISKDDHAKRLELLRSVRKKVDSHLRIPIPFDRQEKPFTNFHVPNLASLAQGPGFPNLSCLGTLSDRILTAYLDDG